MNELEVFKVLRTILYENSSMRTGQPHAAEEDYVLRLKAPEQLLNVSGTLRSGANGYRQSFTLTDAKHVLRR